MSLVDCVTCLALSTFTVTAQAKSGLRVGRENAQNASGSQSNESNRFADEKLDGCVLGIRQPMLMKWLILGAEQC